MKILYVITGLGLGGAEKVVADLADHMMLRGHEVKIAYLKGSVLVKPQSKEVELIYLGLESGWSFFSASKKYRKLIQECRPDIVHAHMIHSNIFARLNRIGCFIPKLICTAHNSNEGGWLRMKAYKYTNYLSNLNTNVSNEARDTFIATKAFTEKNLCTIYNGINLNRFFNKKNSTEIDTGLVKFLSVGRLNQQKDYPNLLHAISKVVSKYSNIHFNIAGEGELKGELQKLIKELGLTGFVTLLGRREDIPKLMQETDFFILSSAYEGFGLVVAEAMASETYVIATDCGGVSEVMGGYGTLVSPKNSDELSDAILYALSLSQYQIDENNRAARKHIETNFDLKNIIDQWERIYESK